jgi:voltage-gated potassium channel
MFQLLHGRYVRFWALVCMYSIEATSLMMDGEPIYMNETSADEIKKEWTITRRQLFAVGMASLALLSTGAVFFHWTEHLSWVDAFYFCTVTLTTVGYGDIVPVTDAEKIFTIFYILIGIGIVATFANLLIKSNSLRRDHNRAIRRVGK